MHATLQDLQIEYWIRKRNNGDIVWTTKRGDNIPINKISDSHLINTIKMLERQSEEDHSEDCFSIY